MKSEQLSHKILVSIVGIFALLFVWLLIHVLSPIYLKKKTSSFYMHKWISFESNTMKKTERIVKPLEKDRKLHIACCKVFVSFKVACICVSVLPNMEFICSMQFQQCSCKKFSFFVNSMLQNLLLMNNCRGAFESKTEGLQDFSTNFKSKFTFSNLAVFFILFEYVAKYV